MLSKNKSTAKKSSIEIIQKNISDALFLLNQEKYIPAENLCKENIRIDPKNFDSLHLLALLNYRQGKMELSKNIFEKAEKINSKSPIFFSNYGTLLKDMSLYHEALAHFSASILLRPDYANAYFNRGTVYFILEKYEEAINDFEKASSINPNDAEILYNLGHALQEVENFTASFAAYEKTIKIDPNFIKAYNNMGIVLVKLGRVEKAIECYEIALRIDMQNAQVYNNYGNALQEMMRYDDALSMFNKAIHFETNYVDAFYNKAVLLSEMNQLQQAQETIKVLFKLDPNHAGAHSCRGLLQWKFQNWQDAIDDLEKAVEIDPQNKQYEFNASVLYLGVNQFTHGWKGYDARLDLKQSEIYSLGEKAVLLPYVNRYTKKEDIFNSDVLLVDEQGIGDSVMFLSMLPDLIKCTRKLRLAVDARLVSIFRSSYPGLEIHPVSDFLKNPVINENELVLFTGSLGGIFRQDTEYFPGTPYLFPSEEKRIYWDSQISKISNRKKIGISWKGGTPKTNQIMRSYELKNFSVLVEDEFELVNIQFGSTQNELENFYAETGREIISFPKEETHDVHDLASLISCLDAVVTVQNSNVHISGAIGTPCFAIIPSIPEWRYGIEGNRMLWYQSVELCRRDPADEPQQVIKDVLDRLRRL